MPLLPAAALPSPSTLLIRCQAIVLKACGGRQALIDLAVISAVSLAGFAGLLVSEAFEEVLMFVHALEEDGLDEWLLLPFILTAGCTVFSVRRLGDLRRELALRDANEVRIRHLAHHDALTGLPNRTMFHAQLHAALARARRESEVVAVLCLDLDRFKEINDTLGHGAGDQLLVTIARRLEGQVRGYDTVARLGGDEFAIVQPGCADQPSAAVRLAERLVDVVGEPIRLDGQEVVVGLSVGVAFFPADGATAEDLVRRADIALYRAKAGGRNRVALFEAGMDEEVRERRQLEADLRLALARGDQLVLHFQPLLDLAEQRIVAFEALVRWQHPTRGLIPPNNFIPLAEETGLIRPLGEWVLRRACEDAAGWQDSRLSIAVNLSPAQFHQQQLVKTVAAVLRDSGLAPWRLELEITEGILLRDTTSNLDTLMQLKDLGVRISLDDFGTGYSSLSYLRRFPFDKLKIDRSFIEGLGQTAEAGAIVRAVVELGRSLGMSATAEGVEHPLQLSPLAGMGCTQAQGYLIGRPMPVAEVSTLLASGAGFRPPSDRVGEAGGEGHPMAGNGPALPASR